MQIVQEKKVLVFIRDEDKESTPHVFLVNSLTLDGCSIHVDDMAYFEYRRNQRVHLYFYPEGFEINCHARVKSIRASINSVVLEFEKIDTFQKASLKRLIRWHPGNYMRKGKIRKTVRTKGFRASVIYWKKGKPMKTAPQKVVDISLGGVFINTSKLEKGVQEGIRVSIIIYSGSDQVLVCDGKIVRIIEGKGIGIEFKNLSRESKCTLYDLVQKGLVKEATGY